MKSLFALPNVGVLVKKTIHRVKEGSSSQVSQTLNIPIKLQNCTIKESDPDIPDSVELIHLSTLTISMHIFNRLQLIMM